MIACVSRIVQQRIEELGISRQKMANTKLDDHVDAAFLFYWREWIIMTVDGIDPVYMIDPRGKTYRAVKSLFKDHGQTVAITE